MHLALIVLQTSVRMSGVDMMNVVFCASEVSSTDLKKLVLVVRHTSAQHVTNTSV